MHIRVLRMFLLSSPVLCYSLYVCCTDGGGVSESTTLACTTNLFFSPARPTWVPLFDSRRGRGSRQSVRPRPSVALLSFFFLCPSLRDLSVSPEVDRPTRRSVYVKRRCWLWRCQVSYNCICAVALREQAIAVIVVGVFLGAGNNANDGFVVGRSNLQPNQLVRACECMATTDEMTETLYFIIQQFCVCVC